MKHQLFIGIRIFALLTFITGLIYPLMVTTVAQSVFSKQANGSLIERNGRIIGSELIGQNFKDPKYFWGRPSAVDYNTLPSGGSNLGPISSDLKIKINERKAAGFTDELLFASGSGLDPHISEDAAKNQVNRIATTRHLDENGRVKVMQLIEQHKENRDLKILGESRINVLKLNLALDEGV